jgi:hypothetical protein
MRLTALLLSLLIALSPWGGAVAQWTGESEPAHAYAAGGTQAHMPCHGEPVQTPQAQQDRCASCGSDTCSHDNCQHCAGLSSAIVSGDIHLDVHAGIQTYHTFLVDARSSELVPDSPPPIC